MENKTQGMELKSVILGGMLHDIGKLIQRSQQDYYHDHSEIGYNFITDEQIDLPGKVEIADCIRFHHRKNLSTGDIERDNIAHIICEADNIASGTDRRKIREMIEGGGAKFDKESPMQSIFDRLTPDTKNGKNRHGYYLRTLEENQPFNYPIYLEESYIRAIKSEYQKAEQTLEQNLRKCWSKLNTRRANSVLQILESTCSFIPSSTNTSEIPDISLYDHLKLTSAIGSCLYLYIRNRMKSNDFEGWCTSKNRDVKFFLLVSADISGIQDFIYTVSSKGALKSLRARSFYLDLLLEHIADEILEEISLSRANLLYTGGGHFYMLLPNTEKAKELLYQAKTRVNKWFLKKFGISLYLAIASIECSPSELIDKNRQGFVSELFNNLSIQLSRDKLKRYPEDQLGLILEKNGIYGRSTNKLRECASCRISGVELQEVTDDDGNTENICEMCRNFRLAGKNLLDEQTALPIIKEKPQEKLWLELPSIDESPRYLIFRKLESVERDPGEFHRIYTKNRWMAGLGLSTNLWVCDYSEKSEKQDELITFEELEKKADGIRRLAVMRADVDSLGAVFTRGFKLEHGSLSRYATLSRQLSLFFKHYINNVCKGDISGEGGIKPKNFYLNPGRSEEYKRKGKALSIVYSGGDDVFVVGAWNEVIEFAIDLRNAFRLFTCNKLTFSAGIGFFNHSFPVYQMANLTGKLEEEAKKHSGETKDAIALFGIDRRIRDEKREIKRVGHIYKWDVFEKQVYPKVKFFLDNFTITDDRRNKLVISRAFLYRLLSLLEDGYGNSDINLGRLAYTLARLEKHDRDEEEMIRFKALKETIYEWASDKQHRMQLITAINILIYMFRENDKNNEKGGEK